MTFLKRFALIASLAFSAPALAQLEVTVTEGDTAPVPIAIVPFPQVAEVTLDIAQVIQNDLQSSGRFRLMPRSDMRDRPSAPAQVNNATWKEAGFENLVIGQVGRTENGFYARFFLLDTLGGAQLLGFDVPFRSVDQSRYVAHQIADLIYEKLLGVPGYFNTKIAYIQSSGLGAARNFQLIRADSDGQNPYTAATSREPLMSPAWSPDRKQLAFVGYERGRSAIYIQTLATGQVRRLIAERGINGSPAWSPDGKRLAVTLSFENNPDIYVMDVNGGSRVRLTDHYGIDTEPSWSPDGSKILFTSDRGGQPQIYEISAEGGDPRRVTFEGRQNLQASYSPDGKSIVFVNVEAGQRIAIMDLGSGTMRLLSDGPLDESPSFAPGGAVIIYATQGRGGAELATVSADGRVRTRMSSRGGVSMPAWSSSAR